MTIESNIVNQNGKKLADMIDECNRLQQVIGALNVEVDKLNRKIKFMEDKLKIVCENKLSIADFPFFLDKRDEKWILQEKNGGCRPATQYEVTMWEALNETEKGDI